MCLLLLGCLPALWAVMPWAPARTAWAAEPLPGYVIHQLAVDPAAPATLYAATQDGVYKTADGGGRWEAIRSGLPPVAVTVLAIDSTAPGTLYAGTGLQGGIYKTTNGGQLWTSVLPLGAQVPPVVDPLQSTITLSLGAQTTAIVIDPSRPGTVYVSTFGGAVYKTTDGGQRWAERRDGLPRGPVLSLVLDPRRPDTLYAGTWGGGVCKTTNGGSSWSEVNRGLGRSTVSHLSLDARLPDTLYAVVGTRVYRSGDGGQRWAEVGQVPSPSARFTVMAHPQESGTLYLAGEGVGILKSVDGGRSWQRLPAVPGADVAGLVVDPTAGTLYAGTRGNGVYRSADGGRTWSEINAGLAGSVGVLALAINPRAPRTIYAGVLQGGVLKTTDAGATWASVSAGLPRNASVRAFLLDATSGPLTTLYAGTEDGLYKTGTGGLQWEPVRPGLPAGMPVAALTFDPRNARTLYAAGGSAARGGGVFRSMDGGAHWSPLNAGLPDLPLSALVVDPAAPASLYVGVQGEPNLTRVGGIYKTTDGGALWQAANGHLYPRGAVLQLVADPGRPGTLYVSLATGTFAKTTNGGAAWQEIAAEALPRSIVQAITVDPRVSTTVYAGVRGRGIYKSGDGGTSWRATNAGLGSADVRAIAIDPTNSAVLYTGTAGGSGGRPVYTSTNGGLTWADGTLAADATGSTPPVTMARVPSTAEAAQALLRKLGRREDRMEDLARALQPLLPMDQRGELVAQQRQWRARRDTACRLLDRTRNLERWQRGIRENYTTLICLLHVTRTRLEELERATSARVVPAPVPELATGTILGDRRAYSLQYEVAGHHGNWYFEVRVHRGAVARIAETALALGFVGSRQFGGHLLEVRPDGEEHGILLYGLALDADTGKIYTRINGAWIGGAPGSAEGMDVDPISGYSVVVAADVPIAELLADAIVDVNLGERPFVEPIPDRYRPVRLQQ